MKNDDDKGDDLLGKLIKSEGETNHEMIIGNFIIFFFAGMDTTAHLATMVLYQLLAHEDCFEKVKKEI